MRPAALILALCAGLIATAALAAETPASSGQPPEQTTPPQPPKKDPHDPNAVICKHVEEIGSRLGGHRVCQTRAQWDQQAWDNRHTMDTDAQRSLGVPGH